MYCLIGIVLNTELKSLGEIHKTKSHAVMMIAQMSQLRHLHLKPRFCFGKKIFFSGYFLNDDITRRFTN